MVKGINLKLNKAKDKKDDEFYTQLKDIELECNNYKEQFKNKIIYLNCDKVNFSNFYFYFKSKFKEFELKKVILTSLGSNQKHEIILENNYIKEISTEIESDGDFKSEACLEILKESDIVITNPPFSLFRAFIATMTEYNKKFLIIGGMPSLGNKDIFKAIFNRSLWLGYNNTSMHFLINENELKAVSVCWYTNLKVKAEIEPLKLISYKDKEFKKYDNFNIIEVGRLKDIPFDYDDLIGVPITILKKANSDFQIVGSFIDKENNTERNYKFEVVGIDRDFFKERFFIDNKKMFSRIIIKKIID